MTIRATRTKKTLQKTTIGLPEKTFWKKHPDSRTIEGMAKKKNLAHMRLIRERLTADTYTGNKKSLIRLSEEK